ncbi:MAG TPA: septum site-determining protein MinC [Burkholderiales bacterium]|jgi:septum site-determining protein MinC|nr:septum site-determining protein MinC [Burkholderiales bacterium]
MSIAVQGTTPDTFEIKSATLPLVALVLKSADLGALARELEARYGDIPDFFDHDALVIDLSRLESQAQGGERQAVDFPGLLELLWKYRLAPVAVHGARHELAAVAKAAGLFPAPDARIGTAGSPGASNVETPDHNIRGQAAAQAAAAVQPAVQAQSPTGALVIDKPLRSGQQVYARGRDLVMLAMVNPGAEVIADGHIHVYAPLRGRAIAGARGNADARIFAFGMEPELISIAGLYRNGETPGLANVWGKPTQARLVSDAEGNRLVFDPLK